MKTALVLLVVLASCLSVSYCKDLRVGTSFDNPMFWPRLVHYNAIPLKKRVKELSYSDPRQQIIKGIIARDLDDTDAIATITSGGIGQSYVNIRLKSERGLGLNYQIELYV